MEWLIDVFQEVSDGKVLFTIKSKDRVERLEVEGSTLREWANLVQRHLAADVPLNNYSVVQTPPTDKGEDR